MAEKRTEKDSSRTQHQIYHRTAPLADGRDGSDLVLRSLRRALAATHRQAAVAWPQNRWLETISELEVHLRQLPAELDRTSLARICRDAARGEGDALRGFLAVMAWGFARVGYGPYRTARMLRETPDAPERLQEVARAVASSGGAMEAYGRLATDCRIRLLGPAFGTKFLFFVQEPSSRPRALILDAFVADWLAENAGIRLRTTAWSPSTYRRYLALVHRWAAELGCAPEAIEYAMFQEIANRKGSQWAES